MYFLKIDILVHILPTGFLPIVFCFLLSRNIEQKSQICKNKQKVKKQELNITPKPTKNKTKEALKATQAKEAKG